MSTTCDKAEAELDWQQDAEHLARQVRAFNPWPVAYTRYHGEPLRIWLALPLANSTEHPPGVVVAQSEEGIDIATAQGLLRVQKLQLPGGRPLSAGEFLNARSFAGERFPS